MKVSSVDAESMIRSSSLHCTLRSPIIVKEAKCMLVHAIVGNIIRAVERK